MKHSRPGPDTDTTMVTTDIENRKLHDQLTQIQRWWIIDTFSTHFITTSQQFVSSALVTCIILVTSNYQDTGRCYPWQHRDKTGASAGAVAISVLGGASVCIESGLAVVHRCSDKLGKTGFLHPQGSNLMEKSSFTYDNVKL